MNAVSFLLCLAISSAAYSVHGSSERVIFTKLNRGFNLVPVVLDKKFTIDCSVSNNNVKISLYKKLSNGKKELVKVDGKTVKRNEDAFELVIRSYFENTNFICHGDLYGTSYEKEVKVVIIATTQELSPTPQIFPGLSKVYVGDKVRIDCRCKGQLSIIKWFKDGGVLKSNNKNIKINNYFNPRTRESTSTISISNVTRSDTGIYRCQATSKLQPGYFSFIDSRVELREGDRAYSLTTVEEKMAFVQKDAPAILDCSLPNSEVPVTFYRLGRLGIFRRVFAAPGKSTYVGKQKLLIRKASIDDMGFYFCNAEGFIRKKISLFVAPETRNICHLFKPKGMRVLCENNKRQFKEFMKRLLTRMAD